MKESESELAQCCLTLCKPMNHSLPGSSVYGIFQARIMAWVPFPSPGDLPNPGIEPGCSELYTQEWGASVQFSLSVMSDSLWSHGWQHPRFPCPSPTPEVTPLSQWCHSTISSSVVPFSSCLQSFPASGFFSKGSGLCIRWPKYWSFSFSISPSN